MKIDAHTLIARIARLDGLHQGVERLNVLGIELLHLLGDIRAIPGKVCNGFRPELRQNKELERFRASVKNGNALVMVAAAI